ncbi:MAG: quinone oxidoreductase [Deltaproteobacteria bacterium]|nr:quinone oxidoreductase [Deltaproteobacteria bacterium]
MRIHRTGDTGEFHREDLPLPPPSANEVRIRHTAVGLNYIDIYHRTGLYPVTLPAVLGMEGAGVVEEGGAGVTDLRAGDRVAYAGTLGAYALHRNIPADRLVKIPNGVDDVTAASMMLKGMTAQFLVRRTHAVTAGETVLVHAAAGGVGQLLCQWAAHLGATVIGTVGSRAKADVARAHGCAHVVLYREDDFVARVREITGARGVPVVYDSVGADTFMRSLDCLQPRGLMVCFGQSSGPVPPLDIITLSQKGSLFLTRPTLMTYTTRREDLLTSAAELFDVVRAGHVRVEPARTLPLVEVARAHQELGSRSTSGATVLLP